MKQTDNEQAKQPARENLQEAIIKAYEEFGDQIHNLVDILLEIGEGTDIYFNEGYDEDGLKDVKTLIEGGELGEGSRISQIGLIYGHYDGGTGIINIGWLEDLNSND